MTRTTRTTLVLAVSLLVASGASLLVLRQVQRIPVREVEVSNYQVAVAARDLPVGSLVTANDVKLVAWPASNQVAGAYTKVDEVVNRGLMAPLLANEPFTTTKVAAREAGAGLPPIITPGMRAISVRVDEVIGVAGFVVPGARVDVVVSITQQQQSVAGVVVANVQVLASGTKTDQQAATGDRRPQAATVVTLLVTPDDAERISLASSVGRITLTLRNPLDTSSTAAGEGTRVANLLGTPEPPPVPAPAAPRVRPRPVEAAAPAPAAPEIYTVETIRAAKRTAEVVR
ncbi:MAG: Flp pilus assembly protein CpaB [Vicinamibacterales bacterium]